jgi:hypothetical protein
MVQTLVSGELCDRSLCQFQDVPGPAMASTECLHALITKASPRDVLSNCEVRCAPGRKPIFTRVDETRVAVIHDTPLGLKCEGTSGPMTVSLPVPKAGYTLITSGCHCVTTNPDGEVMIPAVFPCPKSFLTTAVHYKLPYFLVDHSHLEHIMDAPIPATRWANLSDIGLSATAVHMTSRHFQPLKFSEADLKSTGREVFKNTFEWSNSSTISWTEIIIATAAICGAALNILILKLHHRHLRLGNLLNPFTWVLHPDFKALAAEELRELRGSRRSSRRRSRTESPRGL